MSTKEKVEKISREVAEAEFIKWCEAHDLDIDEKFMDTEELEDFRKIKKNIVVGITRGNITIDGEKATVVTKFSGGNSPDKITFNSPTGATFMAADRVKAGQNVGSTYAKMADVTGLNSKTFSQLDARDLKYCLGVFALLTS